MSEAVPPLSQYAFMAWCPGNNKQRDKFTFFTFHTEFVGVVMNCLRTSNFRGSTFFAIKPKTKYRFHVAAILLFYTIKMC